LTLSKAFTIFWVIKRVIVNNRTRDIPVASAIGTDRLTAKVIERFAKTGVTKDGKAKLTDGKGLYLMRTPAGSTCWRLRYVTPSGEDGTLALGVYPEVSLKEARDARDAARLLLRQGVDPMADRKSKRIAAEAATDRTFKGIAELWLERNAVDWSDIHATTTKQAFVRDIYPVIGSLQIDAVTPEMIGVVFERILDRGVVESAKKIHRAVARVFRYAKAKGLLKGENPAIDARELIPKKSKTTGLPALRDIDALRDILRRADAAPITPVVRLASRLCAFAAARLGNVVEAEWGEFNLDADVPTWTIPRAKMKMRDRAHDHVIYLGPTIANDLRERKRATSGRGYVFPSPTGNAHITRESVEKTYRRTLGLEGKHSPHGWRSSFSTLANDALRADGSRLFEKDAIEMCLDHVHDSAVVRAYDRGQRLQDRIALARWWDSQLCPPPSDVIPITAARTA
jgi:integrase